jgi:MFS family permease
VDARVRRYFLFQVLWSFELWHPFWTLWLFTHATWFQGTLVDVVFWGVSLLIAMPAGAIADRYGRRRALLVGIVLWNAGIFLFGMAQSLPAFALANATWAFGAAFMFSAGSAYLYDTLAEAGQEARYPREASRAAFLGFLATAVGSAVGGAIVTVTGSFQSVLLLNVGTGAFAVATVFTFREPSVHRMPAQDVLSQIRTGLQVTRRNRPIVLLILFQVLIGIVTYVMAFFRAPYIEGIVERNYLLLGIAFAGFFTVAGIAGLSFRRVLERLGETGSLALTYLLVFPPFLVVYAVSVGFFAADVAIVLAILTQICFYVIWGLESPVVTTIINRRVGSSDRATVLSVSIFFTTLSIAVLEPVVGFLATQHDLAVGLTILAGIAAIPTAFAVLAFRAADAKVSGRSGPATADAARAVPGGVALGGAPGSDEPAPGSMDPPSSRRHRPPGPGDTNHPQ